MKNTVCKYYRQDGQLIFSSGQFQGPKGIAKLADGGLALIHQHGLSLLDEQLVEILVNQLLCFIYGLCRLRAV